MGSPAGGKAASIAYALIETAKLNGLDPQAWLADYSTASPNIRATASTSCCRGTVSSIERFPKPPGLARAGSANAYDSCNAGLRITYQFGKVQ